MLNGKGIGEVVALGFTAGFIGAAAVLLAAKIVYYIGIGPVLGVSHHCRWRRRAYTGLSSGAVFGASRSALSSGR